MDFTPTKGHEQQGYRPAIVVSNANFNNFARGVALVSVTSTALRKSLFQMLIQPHSFRMDIFRASSDYLFGKLCTSHSLIANFNKVVAEVSFSVFLMFHLTCGRAATRYYMNPTVLLHSIISLQLLRTRRRLGLRKTAVGLAPPLGMNPVCMDGALRRVNVGQKEFFLHLFP
jgi:hypothetical protein